MNVITPFQDLYQSKVIAIKSVPNPRQLGGYVTQSGKTIRENCLLRSGNLAALSDEDRKTLKDVYNVTHVIDFRTTNEFTQNPDVKIEGATYTHIRVIPDMGLSTGQDLNLDPIQRLAELSLSYYRQNGGLDTLYEFLVTSDLSQKGYQTFFDILLENEGSTLYHCSAGKDRAGMASIFLLSALGVDFETILDDYESSNVYYAPRLGNMRDVLERKDLSEKEIADVLDLAGVNRYIMRDALQKIETLYGGMDAYLKNQLNLSDIKREKLFMKYLQN